MKRIFALVLSGVLTFGLFSGCVRDKTPYIPTGDGLNVQENTKPTAPTQKEQQLTLCYYPDRSLNPFSCGDYTNRTVLSLVYQPLFALDPGYKPVPVLCRKFSVSRDMKTYTFYLENATFSDGSALTAADVAASLLAARGSSVYGGRLGNVVDVSSHEDGSVTVELAVPYENLPLLLDVPIVKAAQVSDARPLGTGAYQYEQTEDRLGLRRRTGWWCSPVMPVTADYVGLRVGTSPAQIRDQYEFSDVNLVCADPGSDSYVDFRSDYELWDCENGIFLYLGCNSDSGLFSYDAIRSALTYAIDRSALVEEYYRGFAYEAVLPASPQSPWYDQTLADSVSFDPQKLIQAVEQTEPGTREAVLLVSADDSRRVRVAKAIAETLNTCGLKVTTAEKTGDAYRQALREGDYDLHLGQTKLSANMDLSPFFKPEGALSFGGMTDATLYALCLEALANSGNYYTLHQRVLEDGMLCPILFRSYAIYADRGLLTEFAPARDGVFFYSLGRTLEDARTETGKDENP